MKTRLIALILCGAVSGCTATVSKTMVPGGEREYCQSNPAATLCMGILKQTTMELFDNFRYVTDQELYGQVEHWTPLMERDGNLYGDCEDCIITLVDRMEKAGLPPEHVTLYLVEDSPEMSHLIMKYGTFYIDCSERLITKSGGQFVFLSERKVTEPEWQRVVTHTSGKRSAL